MGIQGLLPVLEAGLQAVHVKKYAGRKVGVDMYAWLHKGAYMCSTELCLGLPAPQVLNYCLTKIKMLLSHGVIPVCVFDGAALPGKEHTEQKRAASRSKYLSEGVALLRSGQRGAAAKSFQKAVDITPDLAAQLISTLKEQGVEFMVAPYEADAQLAFLSHSKYVACVISEDSDLVVFGCSNVLYKMDGVGHGREFTRDCLLRCTELTLTEFDPVMLRLMCILSGCDYLASIHGIGLKIAHGFVSTLKTAEKILRRIRLEGKLHVPPTYEAQLRHADMTFLHQRVWDPYTKALIHLTPLTDLSLVSTLDFLGPSVEPDIAQGIAEGTLHPSTRQPYRSHVPDPSLQDCRVAFLEGKGFRSNSITSSRPITQRHVLPSTNCTLTKYFQALPSKQSSLNASSAKISDHFLQAKPTLASTGVMWCSPYFSSDTLDNLDTSPGPRASKRQRDSVPEENGSQEVAQCIGSSEILCNSEEDEDSHLSNAFSDEEYDTNIEDLPANFESEAKEGFCTSSVPWIESFKHRNGLLVSDLNMISRTQSLVTPAKNSVPILSRSHSLSLARTELIHSKEGGTFKLEVFGAVSMTPSSIDHLGQQTTTTEKTSLRSRSEIIESEGGSFKLEIFS